MSRRSPSLALLLCAALAVAAAGAVPAGAGGEGTARAEAAKKRCKPKRSKRVRVGDDYFSPARLTVRKCTKVRWKWEAANIHADNVTLVRGPRGVRKRDFSSITGAFGVRFNRTLRRKGTYEFVCTIHRTVMSQRIEVGR